MKQKTLHIALFAAVTLAASVPAAAQDGFDFGSGDLGEGEVPTDDDGTTEEEPAPEADDELDDLDKELAGDAPVETAAPAETKAETETVEDAPSGTDLTQLDRIRAVSRKTFLKRGRFSLTPVGGLSLNDAFYRHWNVGGRFAYHIVDSLSLEVSGSWVAWQQELDAISFLRRTQNAITDNATVFGYADAGVSFSPVYGKVAVMKEWILHFDAFVTGGVGAVFDSNVDIVHPALEVGVGTRMFLLDWLTLQLEVRDYIYPQDRRNVSAVQNLLMFNVGVGFFFPFGFSYENVAFKVVG